MPDSTLFSMPEEKIGFTYDELSRAMQFLIDAEHEALRLYRHISNSIDNNLAVELLKDVADGESNYAESLKSTTVNTVRLESW